MAILPTPESSRGIWDAIKGSLDLFSKTNKDQGTGENFALLPVDEYESSLKEEEILKLVDQWKKTYAVYYEDIDKTQQLAFKYWIGQQSQDDALVASSNSGGKNQVTDNLIFEAVETFLPIATRANPDPLVTADPSEIGQELAKNIKVALVNWADGQKLRRKLAGITRDWIIYRIGVGKLSWNPRTKEIEFKKVNPRRIIFDRDGHTDEAGRFVGEYIGEKKQASAEILSKMFPSKAKEITEKAQGKMGTKLEYYEWWYRGLDVFFTMDSLVLGKFKNPNWNYDIPAVESVPGVEEDPENGIEGQPEVPGQEAQPGVNHLKEPTAPYVFLNLFSTGLHPHDDTSLVLQNITIQDFINRRYRQEDRNIDRMNNGMVVSGRAFTEEQAANAASALAKGMAIRVPDGDVDKAVKSFPATPLPAEVYTSKQDARNELRNIFGTSGSTPSGVQKEDTARGKILVSQQDSSRIGGGITEQLEQVADSVYNYVVQMMYVFYDEEHLMTAAGAQGGQELIAIKNSSFPLIKTLDITVKEGSLIPKDPLTQRNEAIDLWSANAIDPLNFFKKLDFPDPVQATNQLILWQLFQKGAIQPQMYLPSFQVAAPAAPIPQEQPGTGGPAVSPPPNSTPPEGNPQPQPASPTAVEAQGKQLLQSVPVK